MFIRYVDLQSNTSLVHMLIFESYMVRLAIKNKHQKNMCYDEIGPCALNIIG